MKNNCFFYLTTFALTLLTISACKSDDTDLRAYINELENPTYTEISIDRSSLDESLQKEDFDAGDMVENEDISYVVTLDFTENDVTVGGNTNAVMITKNGAHVRIVNTRQGVKFILSGTSSDGGLLIFSEKKYMIELAGLSLANPEGSVINNQGKKTCYVALADGSENRLEDGAGYSVESSGIQAKGAFFSEGQMIFSGSGKLDVYANNKHGIACDDYIRLRKGIDVYVKVNKHEGYSGSGIKANDGFYMNGGVVNMEIETDGGKGISCEDSVIVDGGRLIVLTSGSPMVDSAANDTTSCAGIKTDMALEIKGGSIYIKSSGEGGKGVNSTGDINVTAGSLNVVTLGNKGLSTPKGIKTDADMKVSGGYISSFSNKASPLEVIGTLDCGNGKYSLSNNRKTVTITF